MPIFSHTSIQYGKPNELLADHLRLTETYAKKFANEFGAAELAGLIARVHDFGKCSKEFQDYLLSHNGDTEETDEQSSSKKGPDHSTAGAQWLCNKKEIAGIGHMLAYAVAGHHAGLPDGISESRSSLSNRIKKENIPQWEDSAKEVLGDCFFTADRQKLVNELRPFFLSASGYSQFFLVRMLFSCLVDADFVATEEFMDAERSSLRNASMKTLPELYEILERYYAELGKTASDTPVNQIRNEVKTDCLSAAEKSFGLFTLTVPTGGGKTLASMAFALKHALANGMKRIIYVIPYTSIIEQNANVFRKVFGDDSILEHHCNIDFESGDTRMKLLSENWDAPIVVTTSVQFFESLHANKTSRCRKLHNLANAVVIFDEAQSLPVDLLKPCLRAMDELMMHYRTSIVMCTATQPAVLDSQIRKGGLTSTPREIISKERNLHTRLKRVNVKRIEEKISDDSLVEEIVKFEAVLVIVSTRAHARKIFEKLREIIGSDGVFHLSAQMCPEHRSDVLNKVKDRLQRGEMCRLISTQLIEAGVDIDFPCVFREVSGVDSMAQAAGRCNREGRMSDLGNVFLFETEGAMPPPGFLRTAAQVGRETIGLAQFKDDLISPESVEKYFELLYASQRDSLDTFHVLDDLIPLSMCRDVESLLTCKFKTLGEKFHFIKENTVTVFVPYGEEGARLCEELRSAHAPTEQRKLARKLQRYAVSVYPEQLFDANGGPITEMVHGIFPILINANMYYNSDYGYSRKGEDLNSLLCI